MSAAQANHDLVLRQLAASYCLIGWKLCLIPPGTKGPNYTGWNEAERVVSHPEQLPDGCGVGLLHQLSDTCALDIDDMDLARAWLAERGVDLQQLMNADDAVQIVSGRPGSGKLLYALPGFMAMSTKRITVDGKVILEFRQATAEGKSVQCVLPPSTHTSGSTYQWAGSGRYDALQPLPDALLGIWQGLLTEAQRPKVEIKKEYPASADDIASAVNHCDPDSERMPWVAVGMALKLELGDEGFPIWNSWSAVTKKAKYPGEREMGKQWRSFNNSHANPVTVGTIFHQAREKGWVRPMPDVNHMFTAQSGNSGTLKIKMPEQVIADLFPPVPPLPEGLLPPLVERYSREVADTVGCDPIAPSLAGLAAVCGAVDAQSRIKISDEWYEPPVLWLLTHGTPADKKTPGSKPMFKILQTLEIENRDMYAAQVLVWQGLEARHAAQMKHFREWSASPEAEMPNQKPPEVMNMPPKPVPKLLVIKDSSSQEAVRLAMPRPEGLLFVKDEMADWLARLCDHRSGENRSSIVESYEANHYRLSRVGKGNGEASMECDNYAISLYGNVQPEVYNQFAPTLTRDGMRARFITGALNTELTEVSKDSLPEELSGRKGYETLIRKVSTLPKTIYELSPEAKRLFREWEGDVIEHGKQLKVRGNSSFMQGLVGKGQGMVARVALVFHVATDGYSTVVSEETMRSAVKFVREFVIPHASHIDGQNIGAKLERWTVNRIVRQSDKEQVTLSELRRTLQKQDDFKNVQAQMLDDMLRSAMMMVEGERWVAMVRNDFKSVAWAINPEVKELFKGRREKMIADHEAFRQEIVRSKVL